MITRTSCKSKISTRSSNGRDSMLSHREVGFRGSSTVTSLIETSNVTVAIILCSMMVMFLMHKGHCRLLKESGEMSLVFFRTQSRRKKTPHAKINEYRELIGRYDRDIAMKPRQVRFLQARRLIRIFPEPDGKLEMARVLRRAIVPTTRTDSSI